MNIQILQIGVTEQKEATWGRVYVDYIEDGHRKFIFKNWIYFNEKTFKGQGSFENEPAYTWFTSRKISDIKTVLDGGLDSMDLTKISYKAKYGTPSTILAIILQEIGNNVGTDVVDRRGWYIR